MLSFAVFSLHVKEALMTYQPTVSKEPKKLIIYNHLFLFLKINLFYLFIFDCIGSSLLRTGFLWLWRAGASLCGGAQASHCGGLSCCGTQALGMGASVVVARGLSSCGSRALERRLSSCGAWA